MANIYDDKHFFDQYAQMSRSQQGLNGAGEWHQLRPLFPSLQDADVLDLGCGYGWHCRYAAEQGARSVLGLDLSQRMLDKARELTSNARITYRLCDLTAYAYPSEAYDLVVSNLALHYVADLAALFRKIHTTLRPGGTFLFNMEHPVFTAGVHQDWVYDMDGKPLYWPVDDYFHAGERVTNFLGCEVRKQHHTLTQLMAALLGAGFTLDALVEAEPPQEMMHLPGMEDEMRRPMMLLIRAAK